MAPERKRRKKRTRITAVDLGNGRRALLREDKNHYLLEIGPGFGPNPFLIERTDRSIPIFKDEIKGITLLFSRRFICR